MYFYYYISARLDNDEDYERILYNITTLSVLTFVSAILNIATLIIMLKKKERHPYMEISLRLCISDLFQCIFGFITEIMMCFKFSQNMNQMLCKSSAFIITFASCTSIAFVSIAALLRIFGTWWPYQTHRKTSSPTFIRMAAFLATAYGFIFSFPPLVNWSSYVFDTTRNRCSFDWKNKSFASLSYIVVVMITCYIVPLAINITSLIMTKIISKQLTLYSKSLYGETNPIALKNLKDEKRVFFFSLTVLTSFVIFWTPYALLGFLTLFKKGDQPIWMLNLCAYFAKGSTIINPIIYCYRVKKEVILRKLRAISHGHN